MKFIKLTSSTGNDIVVNVARIGHMYKDGDYTRVGVTTHNNGGFSVKETIEEILKLIQE